MQEFTLTSPKETKGFTGKKFREILSCELGQDTTARLQEIHLDGGGCVKWRISGFGSTLEIPASPNRHSLDIGDYDNWDGNLKIEASAQLDRVYPFAWIKGVETGA